MRFSLQNIPHRVRLLLAEVRHAAGRASAENQGIDPGIAQISQLEQRLMMSASPAAAIAEPPAESASVDAILDEVFEQRTSEAEGSEANSTGTTDQQATSSEPTEQYRELVVIDSSVDDPQSWAASIQESGERLFDVLTLSSDEDGIQQISEYLRSNDRPEGRLYSSIHIVSHGADGQVHLGNSVLSNSSLSGYENELQSWAASISEEGDVLFYGCDLAATSEGEQLVESLSDLWAIDIAASADDTGHRSLGGNWDLEYTSGLVETTIAFSAAHQQTWLGTLSTNAAPVHSIPSGQTVPEGRILEFSASAGNQLQITDADVGTNDLQVSLTVSNGTLTIEDDGGSEYVTGDGFNDSQIVLQGSLTEVNAALATFWYTVDTNFTGPVELSITTNDLGNGGAVSAAETTDTVSILVHERYTTSAFSVAANATDELNRNTHRGVSRSIAATAGGNLVTVWKDAADNAWLAIHDSNDQSIASFQLTAPTDRVTDISVATGQREDFVVVWSEGTSGNEDVYFQQFTETGTPVGTATVANNATGSQQAATIARNAAGDFVVAWESSSDGIQVRRFAADGSAIDAIPLSVGGLSSATNASVGIDRDRNLLVGWQDSNGHQSRFFDGTTWGSIDVLSTGTNARGSDLAMAEDGTAVIAWHEQGSNWAVRFQRYLPDGTRNGSIDSAASVPSGDELNPSVAIAESGDFVIAWETNANIQARRYSSSGNPLSSDLDIASTAQFENNASVAAVSSTDFAVFYTIQNSSADVAVVRRSETLPDDAAPSVHIPNSITVTANSSQSEQIMAGDDVTIWSSLYYGFDSADPSLVSEPGIAISESGLYRNLTITPEADQIGTTNLQITVVDEDSRQTQKNITVNVASPTIVVNTTADELDGNVSSILDLIANPGGTGISLREAITAANNTTNYGRRDRIEFNIGAGGQQTIVLTSELPDITDPVFIDGQTQPGYSGSPLIGLDGRAVTGNGFTIQADDAVVRGLAIFGFQQSGIDLNTGNGILIQNADDARIYSNYIGTDQSGQTAISNARDGIRIIGQSHENVIGGVGDHRKNVIAGNNANGVVISGETGTPSNTNEVSYNIIGLAADGTTRLANGFSGIDLQNTYRTQVLNNVISGNSDSGITLTGLTTETRIQGNYIGVAADGVTARGNNGDGIALYTLTGSGPSQTEIGGTANGEANIIANNGQIGVRLDSGGGVGNSIRGNRIYGNVAGLGIDLLGVNSNDSGDSDSGTNDQQNYPVITSAELIGGDLRIQGTLNSEANGTFLIDVYSSVVADSSDYGEAETYLGTLSVSTDATGNVAFDELISAAATSGGQAITATATDLTGSTSEFSQNTLVSTSITPNSPPTVSLSNSISSLDENTDTSSGVKIADIVITDDGQGTNRLSLTGADASSFEIAGTELRLRPDVQLDFEQQSTLSVEVQVDDDALAGSPEDSVSLNLAINDRFEIPAEAIWFATVNDVNAATGASGATSWDNGTAMVLSDPHLRLGSGQTQGHLSKAFDVEAFVQDGATALTSLHVVSREITVGTSTSITLNPGDILFSTSTSEAFHDGALTTTQHDLVLFQPTTTGDYRSGTFSILLDGIGGSGGLEYLSAMTLIEQTTTIGDTTVEAGDFLVVTTANFGRNDVRLYEVDSVGEGTTVGTATRLLNGVDLGISGLSPYITGLELVETTTTIGGQTLNSGTLLVASNNSPSDLSTDDNDIFALNVTQTEIGSSNSQATSFLVVDGDDIGLKWVSSISFGNRLSDVAAYSAIADATLDKGNDETNYGFASTLTVNKGGGDLGNERTALRFDLSALPAEAVITSAQLRLEATSVTGSYDIEAYQLFEQWVEGSVTFNERQTGVNWTEEGGTVQSAVLDSVEVNSAGTFFWDITGLARGWYDGTTVNNGLLLGSSESGTEEAIFHSREGATPPQLIIEYSTDPNSTPTASAGGPYSINEGDSITLDASGSTDPDGDALTFAWDLDNDGAFDDATGASPTIAWNSLPAALRDDGTYTIAVSVSDGMNPAQTASTTLTISNTAPSGNADSGYSTDADTVLTINDLLSNDTDPAGGNDILTIDAVNTSGTTGTVSVLSGTSVRYNPNGNFASLKPGESATDSFTYSLSDDDGGTDSGIVVTLTINGVNDAPTNISLDNLTLTEGSAGAVVGQLTTTDVDSTDSHTYTVDDNRFEVIGSTLRLKSGIAVDYETQQSIDLNIISTDIAGSQTNRTFTISVIDQNDTQPQITTGQIENILDTVSDGTIVGTVLATDPDTVGTLQDYAIDSGDPDGVFSIDPTTGQITVANSSLLNAQTTPIYNLTVSVSDGNARSAGSTYQINVSAGDTSPTATDDALTVSEGGTITGAAGGPWFDDSWQRRREITIDNSGIPSDLVNHPLGLKFHPSDANSINIDYSHFNADGSDLVFVDPDGTVLAYEIESWDPTGYSYVWVRVPVIEGDTTDSITMYYDSTQTNPSPNPTETWRDSDSLVLHLNGTTVNSSGLTAAGGAADVTAVYGPSGLAAFFDGARSQIRFDADGAIDNLFAGGGSISAWIHPTGWGEFGYGRILDKAATTFSGLSNDAGWALQVGRQSGEGQLIFELGFSGDNGRWRTTPGSITLNQWHHVSVVYDSSNASNDPRIYINGVEQTLTETDVPSGTALSDSANDLVVGNYSQATTRTFQGAIDEVRVRSRQTQAAEILAEYRDLAAPVTSAGAEQSGNGLLYNDLETDGDTLTATLVSGPNHAQSFQLNPDGSFTYTHNDSETTTDSFVYSISDGTFTSTATVSLNITPQNDNTPVVASGQSFTLSESESGGTSIGIITATDVDTGTTLSNWTITAGNEDGLFQLNSTTGALTVAAGANLDYEAQRTHTLQVTVSDGTQTSSVTPVVINLSDENDNSPVIAANQEFEIAEDVPSGTNVGTVLASDADTIGSLSAWSIISGNDLGHFQIDESTGVISVSPNASLNFDAIATYSLGVTVSDGLNTSTTQTVTVRITDVDLPPTISAINDQTLSEDSTRQILISLSDPDTDLGHLTVTATAADSSLFSAASLNITGTGNSRQLLLSPRANTFGQTTLTVSVSDGSTTVNQSFLVTVTAVNDAPVIELIADQTIEEDTTISIPLNISDIDSLNSAISVTASSDNTGLLSVLSVSEHAGVRVLQIEPRANQYGSADITVTATDGIDAASQTFRLNVLSVNDAPSFSETLLERRLSGQSTVFTEADLLQGVFDRDSSALQIIVQQMPNHGQLIQTALGQYQYTASDTFSDVDQFRYVVTDGQYQTAVRTVEIRREMIGPISVAADPGYSARTESSSRQQESSSAAKPKEESSTSESTTSDSPQQAGRITAQRGTNTANVDSPESGPQSHSTDQGETPFAGLQLISSAPSDFLFRKVVTVNESDGERVRTSTINSGNLQTAINRNRRVAMEQSFDHKITFTDTDWEYYTDLKSTVGGVGEFREGLKNEFAALDLTTGTITLAGTSVAVGFVVTAVRSGMLALGFLSQLPVWTLFDPLMVVEGITGDESEEDSLQDIVDRQSELHDEKQHSQRS